MKGELEKRAGSAGSVPTPNVTFFKNKADFSSFHLKAGEV